jgi:hypothetical protein
MPLRAQQQLNTFDASVMEASVACELSKAAKALKRHKIDPARMHAKLDMTGSDVKNKEGSLSFTIPLPMVPVTFGGSIKGESKQSQTFGYHGIRNIDVGNKINCGKSFAIDLGLSDCISKSQFAKGDSVECSQEVVATAAADANFKVQFWIVNAGPSGSYSVTRTIKVAVEAPPPPKK